MNNVIIIITLSPKIKKRLSSVAERRDQAGRKPMATGHLDCQTSALTTQPAIDKKKGFQDLLVGKKKSSMRCFFLRLCCSLGDMDTTSFQLHMNA